MVATRNATLFINALAWFTKYVYSKGKCCFAPDMHIIQRALTRYSICGIFYLNLYIHTFLFDYIYIQIYVKNIFLFEYISYVGTIYYIICIYIQVCVVCMCTVCIYIHIYMYYTTLWCGYNPGHYMK